MQAVMVWWLYHWRVSLWQVAVPGCRLWILGGYLAVSSLFRSPLRGSPLGFSNSQQPLSVLDILWFFIICSLLTDTEG